MSCQIKVTYTKPKDELVEKLRQAIAKLNGQFQGDKTHGSFEVDTQIGTFKAYYTIVGDEINIDVEKKPFFISCQRIQDEINKYVSTHESVESLNAGSLNKLMVVESVASTIIWEKQFQKEVCVNIPIIGRKCISITASVKLTQENGSYLVEIELLGQRIKHQLLDVCYDVFSVSIASIKVCTTNVVFEGDQLKSLKVTVDACVDTQIVGIPIKECWTLFEQEIKFFELTSISFGSELLQKTETIEKYFIGVESANTSFADEEYLSNAYCHFITYDGGNDKDPESKIQLSYKLKYGASGVKRIIADSPMQTHGRFPDGDDRNIDLQVKGKIPLNDILNNSGEFEIAFEPDGDDTWKFHYSVIFVFSAGTTLEMKAGRDQELSDHNRSLLA